MNSSIEAHNEAARKEDQAFWQDFDRTTVRPEIGGPCTNCPSQAVTGANGDGVLGEVTVSARRPYSASPGQPKIFQWLGDFIVNHYDDQTVYGFTKGMIETTPVHGLYVFWNGTNMLPDEPNGAVYSEGSRVLAALSLVPVPGESQALKVAEDVAELSSLNPTHFLTRTKTQMQSLINDIRANGIKEAIEFVEFNGQKYIVGGNHRFFAAQKLGIQNVPVKQVQLPFAGYKTPADLILEGKMPGYWKYLK